MKKLAAIGITLLFFASSASAQVILNASENARMLGMGVANEQIVDDFNIFINPAQITNFKNNVYLEVGHYTASNPAIGGGAGSANQDGITTASQWGGANLDAGYGTWGVYIGRTYEGALVDMEADGAGTAPLANRFDLFYGLAGAPVGFYLSYASLGEEDKDVLGEKDTDEASEINVGVGGIFGPLEAALNISLPSSECKSGQATAGGGTPCTAANVAGLTDGDYKVESDAGPTLSLLGRHTMPTQGGNLLSTLVLSIVDQSFKETDAGTTLKVDLTGMEISLGTALNARPNPETLFVLGIGVEYGTFEGKASGVPGKIEETSLTIPLNVGLEHQTFSKVKTRFGIAKPLLDTLEESDNLGGGPKITHDTEADGAATVSAGIGWHPVDSVELDFVINQDVIFSGTYALSGVSETLSSVVSATYRFN